MKGVFRYPGSKTRAAPQIISYFPPHDVYVEVFAGSAAVLLQKTPTRVEVLNDINGDITNFFQVLTYHFDDFEKRARFLVNSREWFYQIKRDEIKAEDKIMRAINTYYVLQFVFLGRRSGWALNIKRNSGRAVNLAFLRHVSNRLRRVQITNLDYKEIMLKIDKKTDSALFYLDPPYPGVGDELYDVKFDHEEFWEFLRCIRNIWIASYPVLPEDMSDWFFTTIKMNYALGERRQAVEYLVSNFPLKKYGGLDFFHTGGLKK